MIRKEYWIRSKELVDWCNDEELQSLARKAAGTLDKRHNSYFKKMDIADDHKKAAKARKVKDKYRKVKK